MTTRSALLRALGLCVALATGCSDEGSAQNPAPTGPGTPESPQITDDGPMPIPYAPPSLSVQVNKVKTLLTGQAATDADIARVAADPKALQALIDQWMEQPEFREKMLAFFRNAFQQGQLIPDDLTDQLGFAPRGSGQTAARLMRNIQDSFPRTVWQLVQEGRPLSEAVSTERFMLTPPLMSLMAYIDARYYNDRGQITDRVIQQNPQFRFTLTRQQIPLQETLDPNSPNYMVWTNPIQVPAAALDACKGDRTYTRNTFVLYSFLFGILDPYTMCPTSYTGPAQFSDADFDTWRWVTVRRPVMGENPTPFYDVITMRTGGELVLRVPRVGFFSTPAFFANWQTNTSNLARVTMNQTLIVALGKSFDESNSITPISEPALDGQHANPGGPCYACHRTLDPMRQTFRQTYTLYYHEQADAKETAVNGVFAFDGVTRMLSGIKDMADTLASHPRFARAWTQKLCWYANSTGCVEDDPEFLRVAKAFEKSGYSFKVLVRELFASPLITQSANTKTFDEQGVTVGISRRDHLCVSLSNRLGLTDVCATNTMTPSAAQNRVRGLAINIPTDGYSRGAEVLTVSTDPGLFFRAGVENICRTLADLVVDAPGRSRYSSRTPSEALDDFVLTVMGLPPADTRAAGARQILAEHYSEAQQQGVTLTDALKSTFVLACMAPSSIGMGL